MQSFLTWLGSKHKILSVISRCLPDGTRYIEPFLGSGSIFLNIDYPQYILNDNNCDLINVWKMLQQYGEQFIYDCSKLFTPQNNTEEKYIKFRDEFNSTKDIYRKSTIFLYLNKHGFNGLCRYNGEGKFNVSFGKHPNPNFPWDEMKFAYRKIIDVDLRCEDFREVFKDIKENDVIYCDPPYVPISSTSYFTKYTKHGFNIKDHIDLISLAKQAAQSKSTVIVSNHYTDEIEKMYADANAEIYHIEVARVINCKVKTRRSAKEIIAIFKPDIKNTRKIYDSNIDIHSQLP